MVENHLDKIYMKVVCIVPKNERALWLTTVVGKKSEK